jgi:hypothetical protein
LEFNLREVSCSGARHERDPSDDQKPDGAQTMIKISHAILHVFDLETGECDLSQRELDLDNRQARSFVQRHVRKLSASAESRHGEFSEGSRFAEVLGGYLAGWQDFIDLSCQVASYLYDELRRGDDATPTDVLVADFTDEPKPPKSKKSEVPVDGDLPWDDALTSPASMVEDDDGLDAAFEGRPRRRLAIVMLPRRQLFLHDERVEGGASFNDIVRHDSALPSPTQKVDTYALVDLSDLSIEFHDVERTIAGAKSFVIPDGLLQCSATASTSEMVNAVERIVEDVAEEHGMNPTVAVSRAKAFVTENAQRSETLPVEDVGEAAFADEPVVRERYEQVVRERDIPEAVPVRRAVATRMAKSHRIRTDTGIEITFPSEYAATSEFIEFVNAPDGTVSIELKKIGKIENR